jgi:Helicase conserved C-terminal domain
MSARFDAAPVLAHLKDFQRATVEHAFDQLFDDPGSSRRFLVADEVGLGKTLVARGVIAKTIERLHAEHVGRIDIVYICSNADIAGQNCRKLDVGGSGIAMASRLTLLSSHITDLRGAAVNLVALTPGTSFSKGSATGRIDERVHLYWLLRQLWDLGSSKGPMNLLQATVRDSDTFRRKLDAFDPDKLDQQIAHAFDASLQRRDAEHLTSGAPTVRGRFEELVTAFGRARRRVPEDQRRERDALIAELRALLAAAGIESLEPDLVILDEFQRFKHLIEDDGSEASTLANELFRWENPESGEHARILLLSATPYRSLTIAGDGGDDDHYQDFLATVGFLADDERRLDELRAALHTYQRQLYTATPANADALRVSAARIESELSQYIARTERASADGTGETMTRQVVRTCAPAPDDIRQYLAAQEVADYLEQPDLIELWKSAPYLLNFLDGYKLRSEFDAACESRRAAAELAALIRPSEPLLLDHDRLRSYQPIDPGAARLRTLANDVINTEAWRMLWIPPSLAYHQLGGAYALPELRGFTKRLVFSSWRAVPRAAAGILSYMAERAMVTAVDPEAANTTQRRAAQRDRLTFTVDQRGRNTGMPALALLYPSPALATLADPRDFAALHPDGTIEQLIAWAEDQLQHPTEELFADATSDEDPRWYWAAPLLLDRPDTDWWEQPGLAEAWSGGESRTARRAERWASHVALAHQATTGTLERPLGRKPDDLLKVLARHALGAPGTLALRTISRVSGLPLADPHTRMCAAKVAWALRGLFNSPEATALLKGAAVESYWREVLQHCIDGDLQAVLDEHAHMLREIECPPDTPAQAVAQRVASAIADALRVRSSRVTYSRLDVNAGRITRSTERLYTAYAMRFGDEEGGELLDGERPARTQQLREAFNSPFWPFVLITTSVGQEGLDFHPYCHAVVHWNLPSNPVDLEQREGRVHRYKGHAVRKNIALRHGPGAIADRAQDPWDGAFELAAQERQPQQNELFPYWTYALPNGAQVEQHIIALPLSREIDRLNALRNALAVYRLAFGQARQEDIIDHLLRRLGRNDAELLARLIKIDLRPSTSKARALSA